MEQNNPLKQYFRQFKLYLGLPSGTAYYPAGTIKFTELGEVGIMPMTGRDELLLKNPDALLNGEALTEIIKSCVPSIQNPKMLLANDIDALITAIRFATFDDKIETQVNCPECSHENNFKMDLRYSLTNMTYLEPEYSVTLDTGLRVIVRPYIFPEMIKGLHSKFEQGKIARMINDEKLTEEERIKIFGGAFKEIAANTFELLVSSVVKIVKEDEDLVVTDKAFVRDFLQNIDKKSLDRVNDLVTEINEIGIKRNFQAQCEKCNHEWENEIDFNPVNFS